jgi:predicted RNA-binding protein YlxR (DUF448 family)
MTSKPKKELVRLVAADATPRIDVTGKASGRGVYLCPDEVCLDKALKRNALTRGLFLEAVPREAKEQVKAEFHQRFPGELIPDAEV